MHIETFGCQMNDHDSEKVAGVLVRRGYRQAASPADAQIVLYNTCSIRDKAEQKVFSRLGLFNPKNNLIDGSGKKVVESFQLGKGMSLWQTYSLFSAMKALSSGKAKSCAVPNTPVSTYSLSAVEWDSVRAPQLFKLIATDQIQKIGPHLCSPTGR